MNHNKLFSLALIFVFTSCSSIKFYSDKDLKKETGIKVYEPKPYFLVERKTTKDLALKTSIIYLPDYENPTYIKPIKGIGSSDLQLSLNNGMINGYGISSDTKIPETITALTGAIGSASSAYKTYAEALGILDEISKSNIENNEKSGTSESMKKAEPLIKGVLADLDNVKDSNLMSTNQKIVFKSALSLVNSTLTVISNYDPGDIPSVVFDLEKAIKVLRSIKIGNDTDNQKEFNSKLSQNISEIEKGINLMIPKTKSSPSSFQLYQIIMSNGKTTLKRIDIPE